MKNTGIQWTCFVVKKKLTQQCKSIMPHKINFKNLNKQKTLKKTKSTAPSTPKKNNDLTG